jgi:pimeloyl-ACP methyl ester carboxylesterase
MRRILYSLITAGLVLFMAGFMLKSVGLAKLLGDVTAEGQDGIPLTAPTVDGLTLHAWLALPAKPSADPATRPGLALLLPMLSTTHQSFEPFTRRLHELGYATLAFDLRGHGLSNRIKGTTFSYASMDDAEFAKLPADVERLFADFKLQHPQQFNYDDVVIIGASIGANAAGLLLGRDWVTRAALLSPGRDYRGLTPETTLTPETNPVEKPVYIAVATDDTYAAESSQWLFDHYRGPKMLKRYPGQQHGTDMLLHIEGADHELLDWLRSK